MNILNRQNGFKNCLKVRHNTQAEMKLNFLLCRYLRGDEMRIAMIFRSVLCEARNKRNKRINTKWMRF